MIVQNAEPFYFPGSTVGCLLIHGFTGAPTEMRPLGEYLADKGYSVLGIRLAGHGTDIADLNRMTWMDWSNSVLDGWNILQPLSERIFMIGLSTGGVLAFYHASFLPVDGVVSMSAFYAVEPDPRLRILPLYAKLVPYASKGESDWQDPNAVEDHFSYARYPTRALYQLTKLLEENRKVLPMVKVPSLLIHARKDIGLPLHNLDRLYNAIGTPENQKQKLVLENSGHVVTRDLDKELVFSEIHKFIQNIVEQQS